MARSQKRRWARVRHEAWQIAETQLVSFKLDSGYPALNRASIAARADLLATAHGSLLLCHGGEDGELYGAGDTSAGLLEIARGVKWIVCCHPAIVAEKHPELAGKFCAQIESKTGVLYVQEFGGCLHVFDQERTAVNPLKRR